MFMSERDVYDDLTNDQVLSFFWSLTAFRAAGNPKVEAWLPTLNVFLTAYSGM